MKYTQNSYYYLISGLPQLKLDMQSVPFSQQEFIEKLSNQISPADYKQVQLILGKYDNHNFLHLLTGIPRYVVNAGTMSLTELGKGIQDPSLLWPYMQYFLEQYRTATTLYDRDKSWENLLTEVYVEYVIAEGHPLLRQWFAFEKNYRNLLIAINWNKFELEYAPLLIGTDTLTEEIRTQPPPNYGLARGLSYFNALKSIFTIQNLVEREKGLDSIRWKYLEELAFFEYFGIGQLLSYVLKLQLVERWTLHSRETGEKRLENALEKLFEQATANQQMNS